MDPRNCQEFEFSVFGVSATDIAGVQRKLPDLGCSPIIIIRDHHFCETFCIMNYQYRRRGGPLCGFSTLFTKETPTPYLRPVLIS